MRKQSRAKSGSNKFVKWLDNWSSYAKNKTINALLFFLAFFLIGGTSYYFMFKIFVPTFFLLDLLIIVVLVCPIFLFRKTMFDRIYLPIILFFLTIFYVANNFYHNLFGVVVSIKDFRQFIGYTFEYGYHSVSYTLQLSLPVGSLFILFSLSIILFNALWRFKETNAELHIRMPKKIALTLSVFFGSIALYEMSLASWITVKEKQGNDDINYVNFNPNQYFKELGMCSYYLQESRQTCFDKGTSVSEIKEFLNSAHFLQDDYTAALSNPNIIIICVENGDRTMVNPYTTPDLYNLLNQGLDCNHHYSFNKTNVSDFIGMAGSYPEFKLNTSKTYAMPFNLPNILNENYHTYFSHDVVPENDGYKRITGIKKLGFEDTFFHNDIIPEVDPWEARWNNWTRDSLFMNGLVNKINAMPSNEPFYLHYLTVHMHMNQEITEKSKPMFDDLESEFGSDLDQYEQAGQWINPFKKGSQDYGRFRRYTLKTMDFNKGLHNLMELLYNNEDRPDLNNTLLVVYGDHTWYERCEDGRTFAQTLRNVYDHANIKQYAALLGLFHPDLNDLIDNDPDFVDHKLNMTTWPSVIVPTILDLLGIEHNPWIYKSKSLFDPQFSDNEIFYCNSLHFYMNEHYTSSNGHTITTIVDDNHHMRDFEQRLRFLLKQTRIIDTIYRNNIFAHYDYQEFMPKQ